jgi:Zn-finger nucleic acid-binding protein
MHGWGLFKIGLFQEWNFANRTTLLRRGVDAHGAREVEAAVLYLVYEARLFGDSVDALLEQAVAPPPVATADAAIPPLPVANAGATTATTPATIARQPAPPPGPLAPTFPCPRCGAVAAARQAGEYVVFPCVTCGGVWVDNVVSERLVSANAPNAVAAAEEAARFAIRRARTRPALTCPVCQAALQRVVVVGIELDVCARHGTWFDRDELPRVVSRLRQPPEPNVVRTAPNTLVENLSNAGHLAAVNTASTGRAILDNFLDGIANARFSIGDRAWDDQDHDGGDSHHHGGGLLDGASFGNNDSTDHHHHAGANDSTSSDNGYCSDNDNVSNSCSDNDGGHHHH